ncbi:uncharacterized protein KY384_007916 [Bacidia gigantensis]|uniref:uncharacterized protein n=1 Tax=Bacidia gigantensis TaxID=2732470 RepID=UPI001D042157|nr:uncharacterized protein KY384_007916 [Bacidia gigantensis]KAG8527762.1 hypothetical protein KY384_007916 [Bacidia gigantensis]
MAPLIPKDAVKTMLDHLEKNKGRAGPYMLDRNGAYQELFAVVKATHPKLAITPTNIRSKFNRLASKKYIRHYKQSFIVELFENGITVLPQWYLDSIHSDFQGKGYKRSFEGTSEEDAEMAPRATRPAHEHPPRKVRKTLWKCNPSEETSESPRKPQNDAQIQASEVRPKVIVPTRRTPEAPPIEPLSDLSSPTSDHELNIHQQSVLQPGIPTLISRTKYQERYAEIDNYLAEDRGAFSCSVQELSSLQSDILRYVDLGIKHLFQEGRDWQKSCHLADSRHLFAPKLSGALSDNDFHDICEKVFCSETIFDLYDSALSNAFSIEDLLRAIKIAAIHHWVLGSGRIHDAITSRMHHRSKFGQDVVEELDKDSTVMSLSMSSYSTPSSDPDTGFESSPDPYDAEASTTSSSYARLPPHIQAMKLPRPFLPFSRDENEQVFERSILDRFNALEQKLNRRLTSEELSGSASCTANGVRVASLGLPVTYAFAGWRTYATREGMKLPLYGNLRPAEGAPRNKIANWDGQHLSIGPREYLRRMSPNIKTILLHAIRGTNYLAFSWFAFVPFFAIYGAVVAATAEQSDSRLQQVRKESDEIRRTTQGDTLNRQEDQPRSRGQKLPKRQEGARTRKDPTGQGDREAGDLWARHRETISRTEKSSRDFDDASPTGGMGMFEFEEGSAIDYGTDVGSGGQDRSERSQGRTDTMQTNQREPQRQQAQPRAPRSKPRERVDAEPEFDAGASGESTNAWDRLRNSAMNGQVPNRTGKRSGQAQQEVEGSYSGAEEEKSYARGEAQREFDKRLEREREGGDFYDRGSGGR